MEALLVTDPPSAHSTRLQKPPICEPKFYMANACVPIMQLKIFMD